MQNPTTHEEIDELKARGYDSSVIEEAKKSVFVADHIRQAFAGVLLGRGIGLSEGQGIDDYESEETRAQLRERDEKNDWKNLSTEELNRCHSSLSFFDAEGMRFHLPAFLLADLTGELNDDIIFSLTRLSEHKLSQFELLNIHQISAVRAFLIHSLDLREKHPCRAEMLAALENYWVAAADTTANPAPIRAMK